MGDHPGPANIKETTVEEEQKREGKPIVLKVHGLAIGVKTKTKQEKDHGSVDKR
jgi:hypothetical protein